MGLASFSLMGWTKLPNPNSSYGRKEFDRLVKARLRRCPVDRATTIHIRYGTVPLDEPDGSSENPYIARSVSDVASIIASTVGSGNKCYDLGGDEYRRAPSSSGAETGINLTANNVTIMRGILSGFDDPYPATGWTHQGGGRWTRSESTAVYWIVDARESWAQRRTSGGYSKWSNATEVGAGAGRWWWDSTTNTLHVNTGDTSNAPDFIRPCKVANSSGIKVSGDFCRLHQLGVYGFGNMATPGSETHAVHHIGDGTELVCSECLAHFSSRRAFSASHPGTGGYTTCIDCDGGNCLTSIPDAFHSDSIGGGNEALWVRCTCTQLWLDTPDARAGTGVRYGATYLWGGGGNGVGLIYMRRCIQYQSSRSADSFFYYSDGVAPSDPWNPADYRIVLDICTFETPTSGRANNRLGAPGMVLYRTFMGMRPELGFGEAALNCEQDPFAFVYINSIIDIDASLVPDQNAAIYSLSDDELHRIRGGFVFSRIRVRNVQTGTEFQYIFGTYGSSGTGFGKWNAGDLKTACAIITNEGSAGDVLMQIPRKRIGAAVADPVANPGETVAGGTSRCATFGLASNDITGWYKTISLSAAPSIDYRPVGGDSLHRKALLEDVPAALVPTEDLRGRMRPKRMMSVGPIESGAVSIGRARLRER